MNSEDSTIYLSMPQLIERYAGVWSRWQLYEHVRAGLLPHVKLPGRRELPYRRGPRFVAFADPSGGAADSYTLAIGGRAELLLLPQMRDRITRSTATIDDVSQTRGQTSARMSSASLPPISARRL